MARSKWLILAVPCSLLFQGCFMSGYPLEGTGPSGATNMDSGLSVEPMLFEDSSVMAVVPPSREDAAIMSVVRDAGSATVTCTGNLCELDCNDPTSCDVDCEGPICEKDCRTSGQCNTACLAGSKCDIECAGATSCQTTCKPDSVCDVRCLPGKTCLLNCESGAGCRLVCARDSVAECKIQQCKITGGASTCFKGSEALHFCGRAMEDECIK